MANLQELEARHASLTNTLANVRALIAQEEEEQRKIAALQATLSTLRAGERVKHATTGKWATVLAHPGRGFGGDLLMNKQRVHVLVRSTNDYSEVRVWDFAEIGEAYSPKAGER